MDTAEDGAPAKRASRINPMATRRLVREDFWRQPVWTYAECAVAAGVKPHQIENLVCQGKIPRANKRGAFRVNQEDMRAFLKNGAPG